MAEDRPVVLSLKHAEAGVTEQVLKATETVVMLLHGFSERHALSILMNASAMVLCHVTDTETQAVERTKPLRREIERCIRRNHEHFKEMERKST